MSDDYLQPADVASLLAVSPKKVRAFIRAGSLRAANLNTGSRPRWIIAKSDLEEFLRSRQQPTPKSTVPTRRIITQSKRY